MELEDGMGMCGCMVEVWGGRYMVRGLVLFWGGVMFVI